MTRAPSVKQTDETSRRQGHNYISVAVDLDHNKGMHVIQGRDSQAVAEVRKKEYREHKALKGHKYTFLKHKNVMV